MRRIVNDILAQDLVLGTLAREAMECYAENKNMAALACLFILVEQAIKFGLERTEGDYYGLLRVARKRQLISDEEFKALDQLREIRNKMFHESQYAWFMESKGIRYPFSEDETKRLMFEIFSETCFKVALKMLSL